MIGLLTSLFSQLLNRNPKHRLGAQRDAEELKEHPFFKTIDWKALAAKQVTPPFIPVVESDESVANFDPEFTSADLSEAGIDMFDDDDPSEDWVSQSITGSHMLHTPNGPLGSDMKTPLHPNQPPTPGGHRGVQINGSRQRRTDPQGSPISNSVQENFRGFSFSGESFVAGPAAELARAGEQDEDALDDTEVASPEEDDFETDQPGGRLAKSPPEF